MTIISQSFDPSVVTWRHVTDPKSKDVNVDFEYSLLGYDLDTGRLDMLLRYGSLGHCRRHRHVASTLTMAPEGQQYYPDCQNDGSKNPVSRNTGDYALAAPDALPHDERGGEEGGMVLLSMTAPDGILFEYFDENMENGWTLSIDQFVENWNDGAIHGLKQD